MQASQPPPSPPPEATAAPNHKPRHAPHHKILLPTVAGAAAAAALSIFAAFVIAFILYRRFRCNRTAPSSPSVLNPQLRRFSYTQLRRATSSFSPSLKLGQGGFGPVFRGSLPCGLAVAVKLMDSGSLQGEREFQNETALASKLLAIADRDRVVLPLGYCVDESRRKWWRRDLKDEDEEAAVGGFAVGKRVLLVYELMHNGSLQDALLGKRCPELLDWGRRLAIAADIAKGLQFLHEVCDPPVIHGDIKPSNILLDSRFSAKIADFGLSRFKISAAADEAAPAAAPQLEEEEESAAVLEVDSKSPMKYTGLAEDDASVMGETLAESTTTAGFEDGSSFVHAGSGIVAVEKSPDEYDGGSMRTPDGEDAVSPAVAAAEVASTSEAGGYDSGKETGVSSSRRGGRKKGGSVVKDWWWKQENGGVENPNAGGGVKDYVMEWIRSEIKKERPKSDWITAEAVSSEDCLPKSIARSNRRKEQKRLEWWASLDEERLKREKKSRPAREWWREEFCEELTRKQQRKRMISKSRSSIEGGEQRQWWQEDEDSALQSEGRKKKKRSKKSWSRSSQASTDHCVDGLSGEMKRVRTGRRSSLDLINGTDVPKSGATVSSTPSMRGTVCYVAPEYGGGGPLSEKCDIYSFGVLLLVLISGRRPLQVTASPMSEFERANLISWARHLAHLGRLLELLDPTIKGVDRDQALLCITVALLCIQRSPARRPSIKEIVGMLTGQSEPPNLPFEFSPSPPGGFSFKSRKKAR